MKKTTRNLLIGLAAVAVLGAAYAALQLSPESEEESDAAVSLTQLDSTQLASVHVATRDGADFTMACASDDSGITYTMSGDEADYSQTLMQQLLDTACAVSATTVREDCDALADYGLSDGDACDTVEITDTDGGTTVLRIGLTNELLGSYCTKDGGDTVYLLDADTVTALTQPQSYYRNLTVLGSYYSLSSDLTGLTIETPDGSNSIALIARDTSDMDDTVADAYSRFVFTQPQACDADDTALTDGLLSPLQSGLTALSIAADAPDDLAQYGLDNPVRIHLTANNLDDTVLVGSKTADETGIYVKTESGSTVYLCDASYFAFLDTDWNEWRSKTLVTCALQEMQTVMVQWDGATHTVQFTQTPADENDEEDQDETTATLDGEEMDDDAVQQLFGAVTSVDYTRLIEDPVSDETADAVVTVATDGASHTMSFVKGGSREYLVSVDGGSYAYGVPQDELYSILRAAGFDV